MIAQRQAAGRHRQSVDADRPARHQADADRTHPPRGRARQHPGLCRYRPQLRPCRRRRRGPSARLRARAASASATSWAARTCRCRNCWRRSPTLIGRRAPRLKLPRAAALPAGLRCRGGGAADGQGAVADRRRPAHGALPHVLHLAPRPSASSAIAAAPIARASSMRWHGSGRPGTSHEPAYGPGSCLLAGDLALPAGRPRRILADARAR